MGLAETDVDPKHIGLICVGCFLAFFLLLVMMFGLVVGLGYLTYLNPTAGLGIMAFFVLLFAISKTGSD